MQRWVHSLTNDHRRACAAAALAVLGIAVALVFYAASNGGTTALSNPASASEYAPPLRLFALMLLILGAAWLLGLRPHWAQLLGLVVLGLIISWALQPYEEDAQNEIAAAMHERGVVYAQIGDIFGFAALTACAVAALAALAILVSPNQAPSALGRIAHNVRDAMASSVALPVVASAFVLAVFSGDAWEAMSSAPAPNISGLAIAALMSASWLLNRNTSQAWWLVTCAVLLLFFVLVFIFLLTTSLLVQPEVSLDWVGQPLPEGVAMMESARIKLAVMFSAIAVLAAVNSEKPEIAGAG